MVTSLVDLLKMGWLWGGKKEDNGSAEKDSNKEATTSKEATSAARVEEVDPNVVSS